MKIKLDKDTKAVDVLKEVGTMLSTNGNTYLFLPQVFKEVEDGVLEEVRDQAELEEVISNLLSVKSSGNSITGKFSSNKQNPIDNDN